MTLSVCDVGTEFVRAYTEHSSDTKNTSVIAVPSSFVVTDILRVAKHIEVSCAHGDMSFNLTVQNTNKRTNQEAMKGLEDHESFQCGFSCSRT